MSVKSIVRKVLDFIATNDADMSNTKNQYWKNKIANYARRVRANDINGVVAEWNIMSKKDYQEMCVWVVRNRAIWNQAV